MFSASSTLDGSRSQRSRKERCIFHRVSECRDFVHPRICNAHAALFDLHYAVSTLLDGNNERTTLVQTFVCGNARFSLSLFMNSAGTVLMNDIRNFCVNVAEAFPAIDVLELQNAICTYMGLGAVVDDCPVGGWLDDPNTEVIVEMLDGRRLAWPPLPKLHKILLFYTRPSVSLSAREQVWHPPVLGIKQSEASHGPEYRFVVLAPQILLKWEDKETCRATPVVINARHEITERQLTLTAQRIPNPHTIC